MSNVARTILAQLGGGRFTVMVNASNITYSADRLTMKIGRNAKGVTHVRVTLTPSDTYLMEFLKVRKGVSKIVAEVNNVYSDQLQSVFTSNTGLETRL